MSRAVKIDPKTIIGDRKRYVITFSEREPKGPNFDPHFDLISFEEYDNREDVMKRFMEAVATVKHSVNSVSIRVSDLMRIGLEMQDEEIAEFRYLVD